MSGAEPVQGGAAHATPPLLMAFPLLDGYLLELQVDVGATAHAVLPGDVEPDEADDGHDEDHDPRQIAVGPELVVGERSPDTPGAKGRADHAGDGDQR